MGECERLGSVLGVDMSAIVGGISMSKPPCSTRCAPLNVLGAMGALPLLTPPCGGCCEHHVSAWSTLHDLIHTCSAPNYRGLSFDNTATPIRDRPLVMSSSALKAAILIVSTTAADNPSADASEGVLREVFGGEAGKWAVVKTAIVPDVTSRIQRQIMLWTDGAEDINLIVTTGGTGFAQSDDTPEV